MGSFVAAFLLVGLAGIPAVAQEKAPAEPTVKVLAENDKVRVQEATYKPGAESPMGERPFRVIRVLKGGTLLLTFPDGKSDTWRLKEGQTKLADPGTYGLKNIGKTTVRLYIVRVLK